MSGFRKIAVVGLGLIGGSFAKALQAANERAGQKLYEVSGLDANPETLALALEDGAIIRPLSDFSWADLTVLALPPRAAKQFLAKNAGQFRPGSAVIDVCGVKSEICKLAEALLSEPNRSFAFFGCHPMAGREVSGYSSALSALFRKGSFVVTLKNGLNQTPELTKELEAFAADLGFERVQVCTPEEHDRAIAYTSQLCHAVSSAYVKSPTLPLRTGLTAGSFRDLSRVAYLDEKLWTELFLENADNLSGEIGNLVDRLCEFKDAIDRRDEQRLQTLLKEGRELAETVRNSR